MFTAVIVIEEEKNKVKGWCSSCELESKNGPAEQKKGKESKGKRCLGAEDEKKGGTAQIKW
jgi:hypothetical protein